MARTPTIRFAAVTSVPTSGVTMEQALLLSSLKENVETLAGIGKTPNLGRAILKGHITVSTVENVNLTAMTATGAGFVVNDVQVAGLQDYRKLVLDFQKLAIDVSNIRNTLNALIRQAKA